MKLTLHRFDGTTERYLGTISIVEGVAVPDTTAARALMDDMGPRTWEGQEVTPESGESYLRALAGALSGPYILPGLYDE
jgi:hypothetical protein